MKVKAPSKINSAGRYTGLLLALLLLNLTAIADNLSSLSFGGTPGYHSTPEVLLTTYGCDMIADNTVEFSNSVPTHHQRNHCSDMLGAHRETDNVTPIYSCPTNFIYRDRPNCPIRCLEYPTGFINSPPIAQ